MSDAELNLINQLAEVDPDLSSQFDGMRAQVASLLPVERRGIVDWIPRTETGRSDAAVHRARVEILEAQPLGQPPGDRRLPRTENAVDGDDAQHLAHVATPRERSPSTTSKNSGKVFATHPGSAMETPGAARPRTVKLMAIRWSS